MKTILVPVDLSAATTSVCDAACNLARVTKGRVVLLHVIQPPLVTMNDYYGFGAVQVAEAVTAGEKFAARKLQAFGQRCEKHHCPVRTVQRTGQPVGTILDVAATTKAGYIVIGSHGHGAVYDLLVGSTTHGVLRKAPCPVLVVRMTPGRSRR